MIVPIKITGNHTQWGYYGQEDLRPLSTGELEDFCARFALNYKEKHGLGDCELVAEVDENDPHTITIRLA